MTTNKPCQAKHPCIEQQKQRLRASASACFVRAKEQREETGERWKKVEKHTPHRTCIACRRTGPKHSFTRLVRAADGRITIDHTGSAPGRGAYLCPAPSCWHTALKRRSLERALRVKGLHPADRVALEQFAYYLEQTPAEGTQHHSNSIGRVPPGKGCHNQQHFLLWESTRYFVNPSITSLNTPHHGFLWCFHQGKRGKRKRKKVSIYGGCASPG